MKIDKTRQQDLGKLLGLVAELNRDEVTVYMCYQGGTGCLLVTVYEGETIAYSVKRFLKEDTDVSDVIEDMEKMLEAIR